MVKASVTSWDNLFTYDTLVHAISGSAGGVTAMTTFYPLDTVRSRLQVDEAYKKVDKGTFSVIKDIIDKEGV